MLIYISVYFYVCTANTDGSRQPTQSIAAERLVRLVSPLNPTQYVDTMPSHDVPCPSRDLLHQADDPSTVMTGDNDELTLEGNCFVKV